MQSKLITIFENELDTNKTIREITINSYSNILMMDYYMGLINLDNKIYLFTYFIPL